MSDDWRVFVVFGLIVVSPISILSAPFLAYSLGKRKRWVSMTLTIAVAAGFIAFDAFVLYELDQFKYWGSA
jgi:hypothetical protein